METPDQLQEEKPRTALDEVLEQVQNLYKVIFIIEQTSYDSKTIVFYLKKRHIVRFLFRQIVTDNYETNEIAVRIPFKSLKDIEAYLRMMYGEAHGFISEIKEL